LNSPLVTVGVPVYRGQQELPVTLECLRTQTYPNLDVLISVDAADQESARACEPFLRRDARFRMQVQPSRLGWAGNTDWTMRERRGEFYIFQQHDDQVSPTYVADLVEAASRTPNAAICFAEMHTSGLRTMVNRGFQLSGASIERALAYLETLDCVPFRGLIRGSVIESIWVGNRTCIAPHFDNTENIACVVGGRRRFTLFPPDQIGNLYPGPLDLTPAGQPISLVNVRKPDLDRFPLFAEALRAAEVAELAPGDAVYIPALWWHNVEALEDFNVLVNYWWRDVPDYFDSPSMSLLHCLLTIKSLPPEQRRAWRAVFDYLIFQPEGTALGHLPAESRRLFGDLTEAKAERIRSLLLKSLARKAT